MRVAHCVELFVERKQYCGYRYGGPGRVLRRFARFTGKKNLADIEDADVNAFLSGTDQLLTILAEVIARSCGCSFDIGMRKVKSSEYRYQRTNQVHQNRSRRMSIRVLKFGHCCAPFRSARSSLYPEICDETLRAVILVLYGTGMRIDEALSLRRMDINLRRSTLRIRASSIVNCREIPIGRDLTSVLSRYLRRKTRILVNSRISTLPKQKRARKCDTTDSALPSSDFARSLE